MKLTLIAKEPVASDVTTFRFKPDSPLSWQAGQYMHYILPHDQVDDRGIERWFTNSAAPFEAVVQITTRQAAEHSSSFKNALFALEPGATIEADGPEGDFVVSDTSRSYVFIVGGIGITPVRSILAQLDHEDVDIQASLLYANRNEEYVFSEELNAIANRRPGFKIHKITAPDQISDTDITQVAGNYTNPLFYISGPEPMVKHYQTSLQSLGFSEDQVKIDDFPGYTWEAKLT